MDSNNQAKPQGKKSDYFRSLLDVLKSVSSKLHGKKTSVVLPTIQVTKTFRAFDRLVDELFALLSVKYYLEEELENTNTDINKCYYHIDNFYHRIYVLEEMIFRLISNIFLGQSLPNKEEFEKELNASSYVDIKKMVTDFAKDKEISKARKRRAALVHRTGFSARELETLWSRWNGTKRRVNEKSTASEKRFCEREYKAILSITVKYLNFALKTLKKINVYLCAS